MPFFIDYVLFPIQDKTDLILKNVSVRRFGTSPDNDQPDYDSVASDEDTDQDMPISKEDRTKVTLKFTQ